MAAVIFGAPADDDHRRVIFAAQSGYGPDACIVSNVINPHHHEHNQKVVLPGSRGFLAQQGVLCPHPPRFILCAPDGSMACATVQQDECQDVTLRLDVRSGPPPMTETLRHSQGLQNAAAGTRITYVPVVDRIIMTQGEHFLSALPLRPHIDNPSTSFDLGIRGLPADPTSVKWQRHDSFIQEFNTGKTLRMTACAATGSFICDYQADKQFISHYGKVFDKKPSISSPTGYSAFTTLPMDGPVRQKPLPESVNRDVFLNGLYIDSGDALLRPTPSGFDPNLQLKLEAKNIRDHPNMKLFMTPNLILGCDDGRIIVISCSGGASQLPIRAPPSREVRPTRLDPTPRSQAALHYMRASRHGEPQRTGRLQRFANRLLGIDTSSYEGAEAFQSPHSTDLGGTLQLHPNVRVLPDSGCGRIACIDVYPKPAETSLFSNGNRSPPRAFDPKFAVETSCPMAAACGNNGVAIWPIRSVRSGMLKDRTPSDAVLS